MVEQLDWNIAPGSLTAIIGANGSGKSTLLRAVAGELRPVAGTIEGLDGIVTSYLPQDAGIDRAFPISVADLAAMGLWRKVGAFGRIGRHCRNAHLLSHRLVSWCSIGCTKSNPPQSQALRGSF